MTKKEYIQKGGVRCPICHSLDIEGGSVEIDAGAAYQTVRCLNCGREWQDVYELTDIRMTG